MTALPSLRELLNWPEGQEPYPKQEEAHQVSTAKRIFALFMEQRTGKTITTLGSVVYHYNRFIEAGGFSDGGDAMFDLLPRKFVKGSPGKREGTFLARRLSDLPKAPTNPGMIYRPTYWADKGIDALVVIAMPSGVPGNWKAEVEARLPEDLNAKTLVWNADKTSNAEYAATFLDLLAHQGLAVFAINGEAITTELAKKALGTFLRTRRALVVADETSLLASGPANKRALVLEAIKKLPGSVARRILDGTPSDESPLDMYAQVRFLDKKILGFDNFDDFKKFHAEWEDQEIFVKGGVKRKITTVAIDEVTGEKKWKNLDVMGERLAPHSFRVKREDCFPVPAKVFAPYRFDLSDAQRAIYDPLRDEFEAWVGGKQRSAPHILGRMIRLDQISSNFWPPDKIPTPCLACDGDGCEACDDIGATFEKTERVTIDPKRNPRLDAFWDVLQTNKTQAGIVWAVYNETIGEILDRAYALGIPAVRYDGLVSPENKARNLSAFKAGDAGLFVSKESSGGRGLNLSEAGWMCYAESGYSRRKRSQSEDRCEVAGRRGGTGIIDLVANDTYDEKKIEARRAKGVASAAIHGFIAAAIARRKAT